MNDFISDYMETFKDAESPRSFFHWSALAAISAVVRKNVYVNKKIFRLYPNLYIMFVAKSGARKGYPVKQSQKLVEQTEVIKVISGRSSIQSILTSLSKQWTLESGKVLKNANAFIVNDELDAMLVDDPQAQTILTTLYDSFYHTSGWKNTLKSSGTEVLNDLYITMLTATNPELLDSFLDRASIKGGFLGRTLIVYEEKKSKINPLIEESDAIEVDTTPLLAHLKQMSEIKGQFTFTKKAVELYKTWYRDFYTKLENGEIVDDTGTAERAGDYVLKIAMLLSINDTGPKLEITDDHIDKGIELFYEASRAVKRLIQGKGKSEIADKVRVVLEFLLSRTSYAAYRKEILRAKYGDLTLEDLTKVVDTLSEAGIIEVVIDKEEGYLYKLQDKYVARLKEKLTSTYKK